mmetsp:Transcript_52412/g.132483  ORF Transcript_52412/g.132483 Transcript_52412/m.132483 type:complete len:444 (+) Transcript_52412:55-1386(+)
MASPISLVVGCAFAALAMTGMVAIAEETASCTSGAAQLPSREQGICSEHVLIQHGAKQVTKPGLVTMRRTTHTLYSVANPSFIGNPEQVSKREVAAWELENDRGIRVKVIQEGATLAALLKDGTNYLWDNVEGAAYFGVKSGGFPLTRGLIVHGGVRFAAVAPEHGLYYDVPWSISFPASPNSAQKSIVLSIVDSAEQRAKLNDTLTADRFSYDGSKEPMQRYPVSNLKFSLTITLRAGEDFVRVRPEVENPTDKAALSEAWLSTTYPIDQASQIISPQHFLSRHDDWCFRDLPNIFAVDAHESLSYPLRWDNMCIFYDYPSQDGTYHAVTTAPTSAGRGAAYVHLNSSTGLHFTKYWSWGARDPEANWSSARPGSEYYEPWFSAFNSRFFQSFEFLPHSTSWWEAAIVPVGGGLTSQHSQGLRSEVEDYLTSLGLPLELISP